MFYNLEAKKQSFKWTVWSTSYNICQICPPIEIPSMGPGATPCPILWTRPWWDLSDGIQDNTKEKKSIH